jgi:hypothetical protein
VRRPRGGEVDRRIQRQIGIDAEDLRGGPRRGPQIFLNSGRVSRSVEIA